MKMLIKNGRIIDPASNTDEVKDILVTDGIIEKVAKDIDDASDSIIDAKGCFVMPGDNVDMLQYVTDKAEEVTDINILPIAAITAGQDGEYLTDFENLKEAGAVAVSEDGRSVMNARVARQAMRLAAEVDIPVFAHCEDKNLAARGVMNAGNHAREGFTCATAQHMTVYV